MPDELPSIHIDTDWKKQAQQEKKRLAEEAAKKSAPPAAAAVPAPLRPAGLTSTDPSAAASKAGGPRGTGRELPPPSFASIVQSMMTQVLFYLGEIATASGQGVTDLDMAKHQLDTLAVLEQKTKNNLDEQEQSLLDAALYETRARFISVATQFLGP